MLKVPKNFRLEELTVDRLDRLVAYYNMQDRVSSNLPGTNRLLNKTDIIEFLINSKFEELMMSGKEL